MRIHIEKLVYEGHGLGRVDGYIWFVSGALPGEWVEAEPVRRAAKHGFAKAVQILEPSPARRQPLCPVFGICGGCHLLNLDYSAQLEAKTGFVREALFFIPDLQEVLRPIWPSEKTQEFRNKMSFSIAASSSEPVIGLCERGVHDRLVSAETCVLPPPATREALRLTKNVLAGCGRPPALWPARLEMRESRCANGRMAHFLVPANSPRDLEDSLASALSPLCSTIVFSPTRGERRIATGDGTIMEKLGSFEFAIGPETFFQTHPQQAERLFSAIGEAAASARARFALDLYAGIGVIACFLAPHVERVLAIETNLASARAAKANFKKNGLTNAKAIASPAEHVSLPPGPRPDFVVVDPPRAGLAPQTRKNLLLWRPRQLHYISCNPATLARDLRDLTAGGYRVASVQPLDMFPHSFHVETHAVLHPA